MDEIIATITRKGQVTLPAAVRRQLGVSHHDKIAFVIEDGGTVRIRPADYPTIASLRGVAGTLPHPMSWQEIVRIAHEDQWEASDHGEAG